jgi:hypothetical protein
MLSMCTGLSLDGLSDYLLSLCNRLQGFLCLGNGGGGDGDVGAVKSVPLNPVFTFLQA